MKILLILLLFSATVLAQTSSDVRRKFGAPVSETFLIRSEALVRIDYAESDDREIVSMMIKIKVPELPKDKSTKVLVAAMDKIVDEIVPVGERGKVKWDQLVEPLACPSYLNDRLVMTREYEKLEITYDVEGKESIHEVNISWKDIKVR